MKRSWYIACFFTILIGLVTSFAINDSVYVFSRSLGSEGNHNIVIDPGHGGQDGGAVSCTGIYESHINLEIAIRLRDLLNLLGYRTKMTRQTDVSLHVEGETISQKKISDLKERVKMISRVPNAILISVHQNYFPQERYSGAQIFFADTPGSEVLAKSIQDAFTGSINIHSNRKAQKSEGVYIMKNVKMPAVLVECGFLSNAEEEKKLRDSEYQKKICCVIASCVARFIADT